MRCFHILIHGRLRWAVDLVEGDTEVEQPDGFYCQRYVLASDQHMAISKAMKSVSSNLDDQTGWLSDKTAELVMEAEEVSQASYMMAFKPINRGHTFYGDD